MSANHPSSPGDQALEVVRRWAGAFPTADVDGLLGLFAEDATFLGTTSGELVTRIDGIRAYFQAALLQNRPRSARLLDYAVAAYSDAVVVVTGLDEVTGVKDGQSYSSFGRVTFVLARREAGWRIVHLHRSALPAKA
ncbi:MAG TPA: SgcJ/EcaC family oxidoreductase [Burkholderiales bacterium]|nr:SgcJ/EcaC family oxidoreductase [Burkholderiales bacterium]